MLSEGNVLKRTTIIEGHEVEAALNYLKTNKSAGPDRLTSVHFKLAGSRLVTLLFMLLTALFHHGYVCINYVTTIAPLLKYTLCDISNQNNYRPIALCSVASKIIEHIILQRYAEGLGTSDYQYKLNIPLYVFRLLAFWYNNQCIDVRWSGVTSTSFN